MQTETLWNVEVRHLSGSLIWSEVKSSVRFGDYMAGVRESCHGMDPCIFVVATPMRQVRNCVAVPWNEKPRGPILTSADELEMLRQRDERIWLSADESQPYFPRWTQYLNEPYEPDPEPQRCPTCHQSDCDGCVPGYGDSLAERNAELAVEGWRRARDKRYELPYFVPSEDKKP